MRQALFPAAFCCIIRDMTMPQKERKSVFQGFHLTPEAKRLLVTLAAKNGLSQAAVLELVIRQEARRQKVM